MKKGQTLLRLDDEQLRDEVEAAVADVELAESQLERLVNGARAEDRAEAAARVRGKVHRAGTCPAGLAT